MMHLNNYPYLVDVDKLKTIILSGTHWNAASSDLPHSTNRDEKMKKEQNDSFRRSTKSKIISDKQEQP